MARTPRGVRGFAFDLALNIWVLGIPEMAERIAKFSLELFGGNTFLVRSLPTVLGRVDPARAVRVVVEDFEEDETLLAAEV